MVQWLLGMDDSGPREIWVEGEKFNPPTIDAPQNCAWANRQCSNPAVSWRYANGATIAMSGTPLAAEGARGKPAAGSAPFGAIVYGEKGVATVDRGKFSSDPPELAKEAIANVKHGEEHVENWLACVKSRRAPNADIEIGHRSATVCHLGNIARWLNRKLHWDPVGERFLGDAEAGADPIVPAASRMNCPRPFDAPPAASS